MAIGATRRIDQLGRVVIPIALRRSLAIREGDRLEVTLNDGQLVMRKIAPECAICGRDDTLIEWHDKHLCRECVGDIRREADSAAAGLAELRENRAGEEFAEEIGV